MTDRIVPHKAIADYEEAYQQANGAPTPFRVIYENGWVQFRSRGSSAVLSKRRLAKLNEMTVSLLARPLPTPSPVEEN